MKGDCAVNAGGGCLPGRHRLLAFGTRGFMPTDNIKLCFECVVGEFVRGVIGMILVVPVETVSCRLVYSQNRTGTKTKYQNKTKRISI